MDPKQGTGLLQARPVALNARAGSMNGKQPLAAALHEIDDLRRLNVQLTEECSLLTERLEKAQRFACHDPLTGLPNRRLLADHFDQAAAQALRKRNNVVLLFLDLDGFKDINDAIGHAAADRLLQEIASRLSSCVRGSDTACRYGGDEFVVLLPDIDRREQAVAVCEKIENQFALAYFIDGTPIRATISLGMATFPADGKDCFELIRVADRAMYRAKARTQKEPAGRWHGGF
jgi:diguanylate cyclase (GGDEF)-like protein